MTSIDEAREDERVKERLIRPHRLAYRLSLVIITIAAMLSFAFFWQVFFPKRILSIKNANNLSVNPKEVHAGQSIDVIVDYCKEENVPSAITATFVDGQIVASFNTVRNLPVGCHKEHLLFMTPITLKDDYYHIELQVTYHVGLLRDEVHNLRTEKFHVIPPENTPTLTIIQQYFSDGTSSSSGSVPASSSASPVQKQANNTSTPQTNSSQNNNTQQSGQGGNQNPPPPPTDNDGVIVNPPDWLPLLPDQIHIPSPL